MGWIWHKEGMLQQRYPFLVFQGHEMSNIYISIRRYIFFYGNVKYIHMYMCTDIFFNEIPNM